MTTGGMFADIPVEIGVVFEGERIRKPSMYVELGGPHTPEKFEILRIRDRSAVEDGAVRIEGPDFPDMKEGTTLPFGILVEVSGSTLDPDMEGVMERRIHDFCNWIEGFMHLNQRDTIWIRADKKSVAKGLRLQHVGIVLVRLFRSAMPILDAIQVTFFTDPSKILTPWQEALATYEQRDARTRGMTDEDVDVFYGCSLCQSFAPAHVCVITPQRYANCGAISWLDGRAAARVDPKGPIYEIAKGTCTDPLTGEYEGVSRVVKEKSLGEIPRIQLYTAFGHPHTSCGCFECTTFYVPECDGLGIVHRDFRDVTPTGLTFGAIADSTGGGRQVDGFHGLSFEYMRSKRFLAGDGGWERIVWMPADVKDRLKDYIPPDLSQKIATEADASSVDDLLSFLRTHDHPVLARMTHDNGLVNAADSVQGIHTTAGNRGPGALQGGITIAFRNVRIQADRIFVRRE